MLKISVNTKGCSGHRYQYQLADIDSLTGQDELISWPGGGVVIEASSLLFVFGSILDLDIDGLGSSLAWSNPNAINLCGCGESFSTKSC